MNYSLKDLRSRIDNLIEQQGEDAPCAAWIYTMYDCYEIDEDDGINVENYITDPVLLESIFIDLGNIDYIHQVIQECLDECLYDALKNKE